MTDAIRFWGVRGSIASPGPATARVGGNTSCIEVTLGDKRIILDAGTGLRQLGSAHGALPIDAHLLLSHLHWDHIQGIPFFGPLFNPQSQIHVIGPNAVHQALTRQMSMPTFPIGMDLFAARLSFEPIQAGARFKIGEVDVRTAPLNHPGGAIAYRLSCGDRSLVYACDTEHPAQGIDTNLLELARGVDVLIYDSQYLPEEYPARVGWGHSTFEKGAELAHEAGVGALILTHHDPSRDDDAVAEIETRARKLFANSFAAKEGMAVELATIRGGRQSERVERSLAPLPCQA